VGKGGEAIIEKKKKEIQLGAYLILLLSNLPVSATHTVQGRIPRMFLIRLSPPSFTNTLVFIMISLDNPNCLIIRIVDVIDVEKEI